MASKGTILRLCLRYVSAIPIVAAAAAVRAGFLGALGTRIAYVTFYPAVMIAALYGGFFTGLVATLLSCLTILILWPLFVDQPFIGDPADWLGMAVFFINCMMVSGVVEAMHRARAREKHAREQVETANVQLAEASRVKSDFLASMSHELRTPLNSILGFSEILQDELFGTLNEKQKECATDIYSSGRHLLSLINDILDLAKVESGKMDLELSSFLLKDVLSSSMSMFKEKAMKHNIKLGLETGPEADIEIEADERKLKQIMFNLLSNAVKFTPDGGSVHVAARRVVRDLGLGIGGENLNPKPQTPTPDRDFVEISVTDTGIGIKTEDMPKLFKEFTQLESVYTRQYTGTGLGLALTKKLVELHRGNIRVESEFGKGSTFTFVIPVNREP